ncbi:MAG: hypothetical protein LLF75_11685 [Eubacteriales bacterium]|nr:hypothetical protein [Eubacteriales bacterium]
MKSRGLSWKTNTQLFLRFLLDSALRILKRGLITAGILATLALVYWSHRPFNEKIFTCGLVFVSAALYLIYCGYRGLPGFAEYRRRAAVRTKRQDLLSELARLDRNACVRVEAAKRLTDQTLLETIARNDENVEVRSAAAGGLASRDLLLNVVIASKNLQMWRYCFPYLLRALPADETFAQNLRAAVYGSEFAEELLRQPVCKFCGGWVERETREQLQWPEEDLYQPDSKRKEEPELVRYQVYCCRKCGGESTVGFSVPFASFLPKQTV